MNEFTLFLAFLAFLLTMGSFVRDAFLKAESLSFIYSIKSPAIHSSLDFLNLIYFTGIRASKVHIPPKNGFALGARRK